MAAKLSLNSGLYMILGSVVATLILVLGLSGCPDPQAQKNEALRDEIIQVHDEAMDKIGYMFTLETRLGRLQAGPAPSKEAIDTAVKALQEANSAMFRWMNQYQTLLVGGDISRDNEYRQQQLEMIREVGRVTNQAIGGAEQILAGD